MTWWITNITPTDTLEKTVEVANEKTGKIVMLHKSPIPTGELPCNPDYQSSWVPDNWSLSMDGYGIRDLSDWWRQYDIGEGKRDPIKSHHDEVA